VKAGSEDTLGEGVRLGLPDVDAAQAEAMTTATRHVPRLVVRIQNSRAFEFN
jgi:hypothetical protein